jgi:hypothetical protein
MLPKINKMYKVKNGKCIEMNDAGEFLSHILTFLNDEPQTRTSNPLQLYFSLKLMHCSDCNKYFLNY